MTALQAIIDAGGFKETAKPKAVLVIRRGPDRRPIPLQVDLKQVIDVEALRLNQPWLAPLMQIGIVIFDEHAEELSAVEIFIDQDSLPEWASPEPDTVTWWKSQEARAWLRSRLGGREQP